MIDDNKLSNKLKELEIKYDKLEDAYSMTIIENEALKDENSKLKDEIDELNDEIDELNKRICWFYIW